jgi:hypothetical protein
MYCFAPAVHIFGYVCQVGCTFCARHPCVHPALYVLDPLCGIDCESGSTRSQTTRCDDLYGAVVLIRCDIIVRHFLCVCHPPVCTLRALTASREVAFNQLTHHTTNFLHRVNNDWVFVRAAGPGDAARQFHTPPRQFHTPQTMASVPWPRALTRSPCMAAA